MKLLKLLKNHKIDKYVIGSKWRVDGESEFTAEIIDIREGWVKYQIFLDNPFEECKPLGDFSVCTMERFKRVYKYENPQK